MKSWPMHCRTLLLIPVAAIIFSAFVCCQVPAYATTDTARVVKYSQNDIVTVHAKVRYSTLIVLPENEEILDFTTGDKDFWIINGAHNLCYIHPAKARIRSNLNLITASGHVYSFLLEEISNEPNVEPDLKIFIEPKEQSGMGMDAFARNFVPASEVDAYQREIQSVRDRAAAQVKAAEASATQQIEKFRSEYPTKLQFDYEIDRKATREPFLVSAIFHDDHFTYIKCAAPEKPAIYEMKDGKPNLTNFDLDNGMYIVPKIMDAGYLAIGKKKVNFTRHIENR
ncbi:MAG TPA: TrbG/VirB9 family P-type conjugative transfer protein [Candidatus Acidoferrales bacterium]|nr:TrbG/VirB9 family P-type conjugative transfer protein [Candidatus Acidoferrales bacterium]